MGRPQEDLSGKKDAKKNQHFHFGYQCFPFPQLDVKSILIIVKMTTKQASSVTSHSIIKTCSVYLFEGKPPSPSAEAVKGFFIRKISWAAFQAGYGQQSQGTQATRETGEIWDMNNKYSLEILDYDYKSYFTV